MRFLHSKAKPRPHARGGRAGYAIGCESLNELGKEEMQTKMMLTRSPQAIGRLALCAAAVLLAGCSAMSAGTPTLRLVGMQQLPPDLSVGGTLVGGISGMDYDARNDEWLLASDDRGQHAPARFYRAHITFDTRQVEPVAVKQAVTLRQRDGSIYPAWGQPGVSADIESLRIDPVDGSIWYASEGDRQARVPSFVRRAGADGAYAGELPYPATLQIQPACECGGRSNLGMEGMSFSSDGKQLWLAMESPPIEDGPVAGPGRGVLTRISLVRRDGTVDAQYAYPLDPAPTPVYEGAYVDNGISEILAIDDQRLLVLERAGRQIEGKHFGFSVRLYEVDMAPAGKIDPALPLAGPQARPTPGVKRLLFDTAQLPAGWADNYEAMAWGPRLEGGRRSLVIASDNNFNGGPTRLLVFDAGALGKP